jgi:mannose-6-phosphate isomerase-like protein (cupin superfamily)
MPSALNVEYMLQAMGENFQNKIAEDFSLIVQLDVEPQGQSWHIIVEKGKHVTIGHGPHKHAQFIFTTTAETLRRIYEGKMSALTAAAKARASDPAPLDLKVADGVELTPEVKKQLFAFLQHFFNRSSPERVLLGEEHSRLVHGGHVIPLYYHPGFRSAWYLLKKGEQLNEPGDTNPFPQAFIFIAGEGWAKIGKETIQVKASESFYVPPGSDHVVWNESDNPLS